MQKLVLESFDVIENNIKKIGDIFPSVITEIKDENGVIKHAIDFDLLKNELSGTLCAGGGRALSIYLA